MSLPLSAQKGPQDAENPPKGPVFLLLCDLQEHQPHFGGRCVRELQGERGLRPSSTSDPNKEGQLGPGGSSRTSLTQLPKLGWVWPKLYFSYTFIFNFFPLVLGSGKSGKMYTVTILSVSCSERRKDFTVTQRKHWLTCGLINPAPMYAFEGGGSQWHSSFLKKKM